MIDTVRRAFMTGSGALFGAAAATPLLAATGPSPGREVALLSTYVAGTAYHARTSPGLLPNSGDELLLRRAPDNAYDPRAIEVRTADGGMLGYVPRIDNQALSRLMDAGFHPVAKVRSVTARSRRPDILIEVSIAVRGA